MRIAFAVFVVLIAYVASYPSLRESAPDNDALELQLRSILDHLNDERDNDEQMTRALSSEDNNDDDNTDDDTYYEMSKRQGGLNIVDKTSKCEIQCIHKHRHPKVGKGKTIKEASKACKNVCNIPNKKASSKKTPVQGSYKHKNKMTLREVEDDDSNSSEEQQHQRREFYDYLMEQLQQNNNE